MAISSGRQQQGGVAPDLDAFAMVAGRDSIPGTRGGVVILG
jgi:hypothetical protein